MIRRPFVVLGAFFFALCGIAALSVLSIDAPPLYAQTTIIVDTFADVIDTNLDCSLREAIIAANTDTEVDGCEAGSGDDVVILAAGSYTLTLAGRGEQETLTGDLDITAAQGLTIQGAGVVTTTIDAGGIDRAFDIHLLLSQVTISDLTIQHGRVITNEGSGAIKNLGTLTLTNTIIQNNQVVGETSDNVGGAICNGCGAGTGSLTVINSIIRNNSAARAGGIFSNVPMTIVQSSIISNSALAGGGLVNYAALGNGLMLINSTVSSNTASNNGGGIGQYNGTLTITNSTIASNTSLLGAGINYASGVTYLHNTIVAANLGDNCFSVGDGIIVSNGNNLSSDATCTLTATGDLTDTNPLLLDLDFYGGATPTHKLSFLSPAIEAGLNHQCPLIDQRGVTRPQGSVCDIGAFEYDSAPLLLYLPATAKALP